MIEIGEPRYPRGLHRPDLVGHVAPVAIEVTTPVRAPPLRAGGDAPAPEIGTLRLADGHVPAFLYAGLLQIQVIVDRFLRPTLAAGQGHRMDLVRVVELVQPNGVSGILQCRIQRLAEEEVPQPLAGGDVGEIGTRRGPGHSILLVAPPRGDSEARSVDVQGHGHAIVVAPLLVFSRIRVAVLPELEPGIHLRGGRLVRGPPCVVVDLVIEGESGIAVLGDHVLPPGFAVVARIGLVGKEQSEE